MFLGSYQNLIVVYTNLALSITNALAVDYLNKALVNLLNADFLTTVDNNQWRSTLKNFIFFSVGKTPSNHI